MGIFVLPLALFIAVVWFGTILLIALPIERFLRKTLNGGRLAFVVYPLFLYLGWWLPHIPGHQDKERMEAVAKQCGWTYGKPVAVPGIYVSGWQSHYLGPELLEVYPAVEYERDGRIVRLERPKVRDQRAVPQYLEKRTFRYGIKREERKPVDIDIWREELLVLDFDNNEILGQRIEYGFKESQSSPSFLQYAIAILLYEPWRPCGYTNPGQTDIRTEMPKLLQPVPPMSK